MKTRRWTKEELMAAYAKRHPPRPVPWYQKAVLWAFVVVGMAWILYRVYLRLAP
jgi:hypothetical protein